MTRRIFITVEYDGGPFVGWQRQDNGMSVQQVLEEAAAELTGCACPVQGAGRTDSGVHATGQVAHLDVPDKFDATRVMTAINALTTGHPVTIRGARDGAISTAFWRADNRRPSTTGGSGITAARWKRGRCRRRLTGLSDGMISPVSVPASARPTAR